MISCGGKGKKAAETPRTVRDFPVMKAPEMVTEASERLDYAAEHFWDGYLDTTTLYLCDSTHFAGLTSRSLEEQVGMYTTVLGMVPIEKARQYMSSLYDKMAAYERCDANSNVFDTLSVMLVEYLYNPNSPVRNEDIYQPFAEKLSTSEFVPEVMRGKYARDSKLSQLNAVGTKASDFTFYDANGRKHTLYEVNTPYTFLFFTNPGCPNCAQIISTLEDDEKVNDLMKGDIMQVVNVYIDEDVAAWREHVKDYPVSWLTGYDKDSAIRNELLYNVRAIPSIYILDKDKKVILKDAPFENVMEWLGDLEI